MSRRIPVWTDIVDRWFSTFWGLLCFISIKWSCFLGTKFSCFFEMSFIGVVLNDEASHILLLETPTNYSRTGCWFVQSWSNAHILKENTLLLWTSHAKVSLAWIVGCHFASEPTNLTIFDGSQCFWYSVAVARSDDFVHLWLLLFVPPSCENKWQPFNFLSQILLSCGNPVWNDIMDRWFLIFLDFFVLYQWKSLLSWITSFLVSLGWVSWV